MKKILANKFVLMFLIAFIAGQGIFMLWSIHAQKKKGALEMESKSAAISSVLQKFSVPAITMADNSRLDDYVDALSGDEDLLSLLVEDRNGGVVKARQFRPEPEKAGKGSPFSLPGVVALTSKVMSGQDEVGRVKVKLGAERANRELRESFLRAFFGQILILLALFFVLRFFFRKEVELPIARLKSSLETLSKGDMAAAIDLNGSSALAGVAASLNELKENYGKNMGRLGRTAENVEMAIEHLNATFRGLAASLRKQTDSMSEIISGLRDARASQHEISLGTEKLSDFSSENVTSLLEVKATADEIAASTGQLFQAIEDSYSALSQFSQSAGAIADNAQEGSRALEETSASAEEINASIKEIEKSVKESASLAEKVRRVTAEEGVLSITEAIEEMEKVTEQVKSSVQIVGRLGTRSKDIEKMLLVIKDVTEQTNLLSLNAAILAAQAGEYGKGFSVVADEMHALSERTAVSTKEIAAVVKTIHGEIADALSSIEATMKFVEKGTAQVYKAGTITASVLETAQGSSHMAQSIQKATEEQVRGLSQISSALEHLREIVFKVAQATEEQSKGAGFMLKKISEVKQIAESTSKGTREQAEGTRHITQNMELANEKMAGIKDIIKGQEDIHANILSSVESINNSALSSIRQIEEMAFSLETLRQEAGSLKGDAASREIRASGEITDGKTYSF
jgi:methyl-accepting chemotaxis protein